MKTAQVALIQLQQGLGEHMATNICKSLLQKVTELLVETEIVGQLERGWGCGCLLLLIM
jgi:hypothetical protein